MHTHTPLALCIYTRATLFYARRIKRKIIINSEIEHVPNRLSQWLNMHWARIVASARFNVVLVHNQPQYRIIATSASSVAFSTAEEETKTENSTLWNWAAAGNADAATFCAVSVCVPVLHSYTHSFSVHARTHRSGSSSRATRWCCVTRDDVNRFTSVAACTIWCGAAMAHVGPTLSEIRMRWDVMRPPNWLTHTSSCHFYRPFS